jgi:sugar phosphate isomerase/epimerase
MTVVGYVAADVGDRAPEEVVELVVGAGYDALDWTMEQYDPLTAGSSALAALAERARSAGLATPQLMVHQDYVTPDPALWEERVARTERAVDAAAEAQIASIGVVTGPNRWVEGYARIGRDVDEPRAWHLAVTALERVLAHAESAGVTVSLEPC